MKKFYALLVVLLLILLGGCTSDGNCCNDTPLPVDSYSSSLDIFRSNNETCFQAYIYKNSNSKPDWQEGEERTNVGSLICVPDATDGEDGTNSNGWSSSFDIYQEKDKTCYQVYNFLDDPNNPDGIWQDTELRVDIGYPICIYNGLDGKNSGVEIIVEGYSVCFQSYLWVEDNGVLGWQLGEYRTDLGDPSCVEFPRPKCTTVVDTDRCYNNIPYIMWLKEKNGSQHYLSTLGNVHFVEFPLEGEALLCGKVIDNDTYEIWTINIRFTNYNAQNPNHKEHECLDEDTSDWNYYEEFSGTLKSINGQVINVVNRGEWTQIGTDANITESKIGTYGGSGWFSVVEGYHTQTNDPRNYNGNCYQIGDFNWNLFCKF